MMRVGFLLNYPTSYNGAVNYFRNLFFAINKHLKKEIKVFLFVPSNLSQEYVDLFSPYVVIVKTKVLDRRSSSWWIDKIIEKSLGINPLLDRLLVKHEIDVVTHSSFISRKVKTINWIMDFQHVHLPHLWSKSELLATKKFLHRLITKSDGVFVSSNSAFEDFKIEYPTFIHKVSVLHFVCQPKGDLRVDLASSEKEALRLKYHINRPFFYLPNQFWSHKNHEVVFKAIKLVKERGYDPLLLTSGLMNDFRKNNSHVENLKEFVFKSNLEDNILFLGLIPYRDVLDLIILSDCVINPSFFEGWSSTVEESKTMGKTLILSDIKVHQEQNPEFGYYFNPNEASELADIMQQVMDKTINNSCSNISILQRDLTERTEKFAHDYLTGVREIMQLK